MTFAQIKRGLKKIAHNPWKIFDYLSGMGVLDWLDDERYLKLKFRAAFDGKKLDLKNPKTYSEKLQWLKLHDRNPEYTRMVDKYEAKKYIAEIIGEEYTVPTLGVWDRFEDIDFDALPEQFVLKATHDSGGYVICHDKSSFDISAAKKKLSKSLKNNYYYHGREWPYKNVKPRILAEKYLSNDDGNEIKDYKFHCFGGKVKLLYITSDRFNGLGVKADYFDDQFRKLDIQWELPNSNYDIEKPENFELMKMLSEKVSVGIPTLRVDFYEVNGAVYVGELTFFDGSGFGDMGYETDLMLGEYISLEM